MVVSSPEGQEVASSLEDLEEEASCRVVLEDAYLVDQEVASYLEDLVVEASFQEDQEVVSFPEVQEASFLVELAASYQEELVASFLEVRVAEASHLVEVAFCSFLVEVVASHLVVVVFPFLEEVALTNQAEEVFLLILLEVVAYFLEVELVVSCLAEEACLQVEVVLNLLAAPVEVEYQLAVESFPQEEEACHQVVEAVCSYPEEEAFLPLEVE